MLFRINGCLRIGWYLVVAAVLAAAASSHVVANERDSAAFRAAWESIKANNVRQMVEVLAADTYEGREAGSRGGHAAGVFLVERLKKMGLEPGADVGYFQAFGQQYRNILALVPGIDPEVAHEVVVVGAHYDHVGYGNNNNSYGPVGYIHNGADDNASGTAGLLQVAEAVKKMDTGPRRTLLFALWDGEEKGLLGSQHWMRHPTVPAKNIRFAVNVDMIGRLRDNRVEIFGSRTSRGLHELVARANQGSPLLLKFDWELKENSDHHSFFTNHVPVVMFHTGLHSDYHRPSDDAEKINYDGARDVSRLMFGVVWELANCETLSPFRSAALRESPATQRLVERPLPPLPSRLGVSWNPDVEPDHGIVVTSVTPRSAAEIAGIRRGDRLVTFDGATITDGGELKRMVLSARSNVTVEIQRSGREELVPVAVKLSGNRVRIGIAWHEDDASPGTVLIVRVVPGSPADAAGLRVMDRIYEVDGRPFVGSQEFQALITGLSGPIGLLVERRGQLFPLVIEPLP